VTDEKRQQVTLRFVASVETLRATLGGDWGPERSEGITVESAAAGLLLAHDPVDGYIWWSAKEVES
jgi:hypothetical protein